MIGLVESTIRQMDALDGHTPAGVYIAKKLISQIEDENMACACWLASVVDKLVKYDPELNVQTLQLLISGAAPLATDNYLHYRETT